MQWNAVELDARWKVVLDNQKELDLELDECCCRLREAELDVLDFYI